mmetsp:Transcript_10230/g.22693  ORF Transcript_10230/g.22693 Transcript_10230/m.22693 type:complete len:204 (+) Transcript_10230:537-1148(+)
MKITAVLFHRRKDAREAALSRDARTLQMCIWILGPGGGREWSRHGACIFSIVSDIFLLRYFGHTHLPHIFPWGFGTRAYRRLLRDYRRRQLHAYDPPGLAKEHAARIAKAAEEGNNALVDPLSRILDGVRTGGATDEEMSNVRRIVDGGLVEVQTVKEQINEDGDECMGFDVGRSEHYDGGVGKNDRIEWGAMSDSEEEDDLL